MEYQSAPLEKDAYLSILKINVPAIGKKKLPEIK